jgi:hypothetical protein
MVPICSVCAWRDKFEFSYVANLAHECFQAQTASDACVGCALCNFHVYMFHGIASSATTALVFEEFIGRFAVSGTAGSVCIVCQALREPEWTLVMREGDHEPPRLCRPHINRLRALGAAGERVAVAGRSLNERSAALVKALMQPEDPDDPFFRRVAAVL